MLFTALGVIATVQIIEKKRNPIYTDLIQLLNVDSLFYHKGGYLTAWGAFEILLDIKQQRKLEWWWTMRHYWWDFERPRWGWTGWWRQGRKFGEIQILILAVLTILTFKWLFLMLKLIDSSNLPVKCNIIFQKSLSWRSGYYWRRWSIFHCFFEKTTLVTKLELKTLFARLRICFILIVNLWFSGTLGKEERKRREPGWLDIRYQ